MKLNQFDVDAAIVDLDGTMIDTLDDFCAALNGMLAELPAPFATQRVDRGLVTNLVGKGSEHLITCVLELGSNSHNAENFGADKLSLSEVDALYQQAWSSYQSHYRRVNGERAVVYPGVRAGLADMKASGLKLACLTNKPTEFARALLELNGLDKFFDFVFGGDAFETKKPDPLPLLKTCEALGSAPARTLMIGDSSNDAAAARAAGCPVVLVTYGYNHGEPIRAVNADGFINALDELTTA